MSLDFDPSVEASAAGAPASGAPVVGAPAVGAADVGAPATGAAAATASLASESREDVAWLTPVEQESWRDFLTASRLILDRLESDLQNDAGMPFAYYDILVKLSEAPDRTLRMGARAAVLRASSSRISHAVSRLEKCGWVRRDSHPPTAVGSSPSSPTAASPPCRAPRPAMWPPYVEAPPRRARPRAGRAAGPDQPRGDRGGGHPRRGGDPRRGGPARRSTCVVAAGRVPQ